MKKRLFVLLSAAMLILAFTGCGVEQTNDTITHEAGQELVIDATQHFNVDEEKAQEFVFDTTVVDVNKVGEYEATATYKDQEYVLKINVVDTTAPMVEFSQRCVFANDLVNTDITNALEGIYDASEYTTKLVRFEHAGNLDVMDEKAVKELTDKIPLPCDSDELMTIGTEEVPEEDGIYRSVLEIKDAHGNVRLEEVYVVYDTMGAKIEDVPDKTIRVAKEDLDKEPELDKSEYIIKDNVDGNVNTEDIVCELELRDKDKHEWLVHVSYMDRAGNESKADFLIIVKEKFSNSKNETASSNDGSGSNGSANNSTSSSSGITGSTSVSSSVSSETGYSYPHIEAALEAGIGNVVFINGIYCVCGDRNGYINGVHGIDFLYQYIGSLGLYSDDIGGGMANQNYTYFMAQNVISKPVVPTVPVTPDASVGGTTNPLPEGVPDGVIWVN